MIYQIHTTNKLHYRSSLMVLSYVLSAETYALQQNYYKLNLAIWCANCRIRLNPEKTEVMIFSRSKLVRLTEPNLKLYGETLKVYPQVKFPGITFDSQVSISPHHNPNLQTMCLTHFRILFTTSDNISTTSDNIISKIQWLQNKFIWLAFCLPTYICTKLLHDSPGLPYVNDRLLSCATKSQNRIAQNPRVEESVSSHRLNPAGDHFPMPLSLVRLVSL